MTTTLSLRIAPDHPALAGHFPGNPIVPGVVLLDLAIRALARRGGLDEAGIRLGSAKFLAPVRLPAGSGDAELVLSWSGSLAAGGTVRLELSAADGTRVASAALTWLAAPDA